MDNRSNISTQLSPLEIREKVWADAVSAAERHTSIASDMQSQGNEIISKVEKITQNAELAIKLLLQATSLIEKGVKLERDARDKIILLHNHIPK